MGYEAVQADLRRDRDAVLAFWRSQHGTRLEPKFRWLYEGNPDGAPFVWLIRHTESGECVGMQTLFPRRFRLGDAIRKAVVAGDLLIHARHRSAGPAMMLQRRATSVVGAGADFIYGFPNQSAEPILKRVGFGKVGVLARYVKIVHSAPLLKARGWPRVPAALAGAALDLLAPGLTSVPHGLRRYRCAAVTRFDERFDRLWSLRRQALQVTAERDAAYMNWKFLSNPLSAHRALAAFSPDEREMKACIVYRADGESVEMRDFIPGPDAGANRALFARFLRQLGEEERPRSVVMYVLEPGALSRELRRYGFMRRADARRVYVWRGAEAELGVDGASERWLLMKSDEEI